MNSLWITLASALVFLHLLYLAWVIAGAAFTRGRPWLTGLHLASLVWGVIVEVGPWPCPLTLLEQKLETAAGYAAYHGSFTLHYLQALVYPNLSYTTVETAGVAVCIANLLVYAWRAWRYSN